MNYYIKDYVDYNPSKGSIWVSGIQCYSINNRLLAFIGLHFFDGCYYVLLNVGAQPWSLDGYKTFCEAEAYMIKILKERGYSLIDQKLLVLL